ncbi:MAG: hypothetical protein ACRDMV_19640, partial [Streptosporangiales bacterium]
RVPLSTPKKGNRMNTLTAVRTKLPILIGATALVAGGALASAGSAGAADHGSQIRNYPLKQVDIGKAGVSGTRQGQDEIAHQSIGEIDIGQNGVSGSAGDTAGEIKQGTVGSDDLSDGAKDSLKGAKGDPGADGVSGYEVVGRTADRVTVSPADNVVTIKTACASHGEVAIAGGASGGAHVTLHASQPSGVHEVVPSGTDGDEAGRWAADGWQVKVSTDQATNVQPYVVCAAVN